MKPRWLLRFLQSEGVDNQAMAKAVGVDPENLVDDQGRMSLDTYLMLFEWAAREFNRPHLGLELATKDSQMADHGLILYMSSNSNSMEEGFRLLMQYQRTLMEGEIYQLFEHRDAAEVRLTITTGHTDHTAQDAEFSMAMVISAIETLTGIAIKPRKTCFSHKQIDPITDYYQLFGESVFFEQPDNSLWLNHDVLSLRPRAPDPALLNILKAQADQLLSELEEHVDFLDHVRLLISSNLGNEYFNAETLADHFGMTGRTLHRRLKNHGTSFKKLRFDAILKTARRALNESDASIADIAQQLGYSDSSGFVRAFKQLQGDTPLAYRKRHSFTR